MFLASPLLQNDKSANFSNRFFNVDIQGCLIAYLFYIRLSILIIYRTDVFRKYSIAVDKNSIRLRSYKGNVLSISEMKVSPVSKKLCTRKRKLGGVF